MLPGQRSHLYCFGFEREPRPNLVDLLAMFSRVLASHFAEYRLSPLEHGSQGSALQAPSKLRCVGLGLARVASRAMATELGRRWVSLAADLALELAVGTSR